MITTPSHKVHRWLDEIILKKKDGYKIVHKYADAVLGKGHRRKWGHSIAHTALLYLITKKPEYAISHMLHILADKMETKNKQLFQLLDTYLRLKPRKRKR